MCSPDQLRLAQPEGGEPSGRQDGLTIPNSQREAIACSRSGFVLRLLSDSRWSRRTPHRILEASARDQVVINRVEVLLLGAGKGRLSVGQLGGDGFALLGALLHESERLTCLVHRRASAVNRLAGGHDLTIRLVHL